ncbi:MAG TPA: hypothetical protein VGH33_22285 [Isosphaeraceae bacterium]
MPAGGEQHGEGAITLRAGQDVDVRDWPPRRVRAAGGDILRLTGSHAESAEVLGHSPEINARHYASFEAARATDLARAVAEARKGRPA